LCTDGGHKRVSCIQKLVSGTLFSCKQLARDLRGFVQRPCTGFSPFPPKWTFLASPGSVCFSLRSSLLVLLPTRTPALWIFNQVTYTTLPSPHIHPPRMHTAVLQKIPHSNCYKIVPNRPLRGRRGRFGTLLQLLECGIFGRTAVSLVLPETAAL